jgi:hypothetical protein
MPKNTPAIIPMTQTEMQAYVLNGTIPAHFPDGLREAMGNEAMRKSITDGIDMDQMDGGAFVERGPDRDEESFKKFMDEVFGEDEDDVRTNIDGKDDCPCPMCSARRAIFGSNDVTPKVKPDTGESTTNTSNDVAPPEDELPEWAAGRYTGTIIEMTQLQTRDGRRVGNATVFDISANAFGATIHVVTDAGNIMSLSLNEVLEFFHEPEYILLDLPNNEQGHVSEMINDWYAEKYQLNA